jgi:hypothetical protein
MYKILTEDNCKKITGKNVSIYNLVGRLIYYFR